MAGIRADCVEAKLSVLAIVGVELALVDVDASFRATLRYFGSGNGGKLFLSVSFESLVALAGVSDLVGVADHARG